MPWVAIPWGDRRIQSLQRKIFPGPGIGIPALILLTTEGKLAFKACRYDLLMSGKTVIDKWIQQVKEK